MMCHMDETPPGQLPTGEMPGEAPRPGRPDLPIRIVVTDDLQRSRVTVFFRLFLAIPHLIVVALWGIAAFFVSFILWIALLFEGRAPESLQRFVTSYIRYAVQVSGYLHLAANPWPRFGGSDGYPIDVEIDAARRQSRKSVAPRLFLALPAFLIATVLGGQAWFGGGGWGGGTSESSTAWWSTGASVGGLAATAAFLGWFAALVRGRTPRGLRDLASYGIAYTAQMTAYFLLVTNVYPTSDPNRVLPLATLPPHPVRLALTDRIERSRLTVFFRLLLAFPHIIWLLLWSIVGLLASIVAWIVALVIGRVPSSLHRFLAAWVRYGMHVGAFLFLVGGPFPGFVGAAGSYPVDLEIDPPQPQRRLVTLFRFWLAIPALLLASAFTLAVYLVAVLGWFAALATGRMPEGIRNLGAVSLRYTGQTNAYLFLLTDRYPHSSPVVATAPRDEQLELGLWLPEQGPEPPLAGAEPA
jgi:Domain of unknown function (DUF4389)